MRANTSDLKGAALDWAVAKGEGEKVESFGRFGVAVISKREMYSPSSTWAQGGPIIEREEISVEPLYTEKGLDCWQAYGNDLRYNAHGNFISGSDYRQYGKTPLVAAMRCYVASKLGPEVEIPDELA